MNKMTTIECIEQLKEIIAKVPYLRFMQLIVNFQHTQGDLCFYMKNEEFIKEITDMIIFNFDAV